MAERRMFSKTIVDSDAFLDMPMSSQLLYFHLAMRADDDGFINNPKKIQRFIGANDDDLRVLSSKKFIIPFESGVVVIKHWKIQNYIAKDRYTETKYKGEKATLGIDENGSYTTCTQDVDTLSTQVRLGKVRLGEEEAQAPVQPREGSKKFRRPTLEEVSGYCRERGNSVSPERFLDYYESNGWRVGRNSMKDWKSAVRTWERNERDTRPAVKAEPVESGCDPEILEMVRRDYAQRSAR